MALVEDAPRSATVKSEGHSLCLTLSKEEFLELMIRNPSIALVMIKSLVERLRRTNDQLQEYAQRLANTSNEEIDNKCAESDLGGAFDNLFSVFGKLT